MMRASVTHNLRQAMPAESRRIGQAIRRAVARTAAQVQTALRAQARAAGFDDGGRAVANAWRLNMYPSNAGTSTWRPAGLVWSKMPSAVMGQDAGGEISARGGGWLVWPTEFNIRSVKGDKREPVIPLKIVIRWSNERPQMAKLAPSRRNRSVLIWYVRTARSRLKRPRSLARKYRAGAYTLSGKGIQREWVPVFVMKKSVRLRKRLNIRAIEQAAPWWLARRVRAELDALT